MQLISSKELVEKYGISYQTLNFYTNLRLLNVCKRVGYKRLYDEQEIKQRLEKIVKLKEDGYPLRIITKELSKQFPEQQAKVLEDGHA